MKIKSIEDASTLFLQDVNYQQVHFAESTLLKTLDSVKQQIEQKGFINYNLDSLVKIDSIYSAYFNLRNQIKKVRIFYNKNNIDLNSLTNQNNTLDYFETKPESLAEYLMDISNRLEKKGNSFSEVILKNISIKNDTLIEANLFIKKSALRKIDKIIINGYTSFPRTFLKHYLKLEEGTPFSRSKLDEASTGIIAIPFVSEIKSPEVLFTKDSTIVYLNLKKENVNSFDGLIGFTSNENGKGLSLNGYLDLSLNNLFNSGESFNLLWKNNDDNRQVFNLYISLPYIFKSKISPNGTSNIYKQDSSFVNTRFKFNLPYQINYRNSIGLNLQLESSFNLLTLTNENIEDYQSLFYGLNYNYRIPKNHHLFNTKFSFYIEALAGKRNSIIDNKQSKFYLKSNFLWSLSLKNYIFFQNQSGLINSEKLFNNELLRIGGVNSIRGFDQESILSSAYSTFNIEYRYNTNNNSYLYSITDLGYTNNNNLSSQLYALGLGYAFSSKLGFVNLSYALGKSSNTQFNFSNSRFHINIISQF